MRDYVTLTGPTDGATAAGGRSCRLPLPEMERPDAFARAVLDFLRA